MNICRYRQIYGYSIVPHFFTIETSIAFIFKMPTAYPARKIWFPFDYCNPLLFYPVQDYILQEDVLLQSFTEQYFMVSIRFWENWVKFKIQNLPTSPYTCTPNAYECVSFKGIESLIFGSLYLKNPMLLTLYN